MFGFFTHPEFMAIAVALISVPIIIHLINRLRFKRLRWAAMEFLLKAQKRNRRRLIIEQLLLLLMRCMLVALAGFLVMRFVGNSFADLGVNNTMHVVLVDDSLSMNDRWKVGKDGGKDKYSNCFDSAKTELLLNKIGKGINESPSGNDRLIVLPLSWVVSDEPAGDLRRDLGSSDTSLSAEAIDVQAARRPITKNTLLKIEDEQVVVARVEGTVYSLQRGVNGTNAATHKAGAGIYFIGKSYQNLKDPDNYEEFKKDVDKMAATNRYLNLLEGVTRAQALIPEEPNTLLTLHVLSDFRRKDWGPGEGDPLCKELLSFSKQRRVRVRLLDPTEPFRTAQSAGTPPSRENLGIVDLRPGSRVVGKGMPVIFTATVANYGRQEAVVKLDIFDHSTGQRRPEVDFIPSLFKVKGGQTGQVTFELRFRPEPDLKPGESYFAAISAHLVGNLEKDGLPQDNVAYGVVEVRDQVPVLIVDGEGKYGRDNESGKGQDSFFLEQAYESVPGALKRNKDNDDPNPSAPEMHPYRVDFGYEYENSGVAMKALENPDLRKYPAILMANVPRLSPKQLENLENYVREGGGVAFFLGPNVEVEYYNKSLYNGGKGIFPVALRPQYYPPADKKALKPKAIKGVPMLLLRDDLDPYPIFGPIFKNRDQRSFLEDLPVLRYFQVVSRPDPDKVVELATLPNDQSILTYQKQILDIAGIDKKPPSQLAAILARADFNKYEKAFEKYRQALERLVDPTSEEKAYLLSIYLEKMLKDRGTEDKPASNLEEFWNNVDPAVRSLKKEITVLLHKVRYGDGSPFVLTRNFGKGKVVVVMSTAGSLWNHWGGGSGATPIYQPFIWEMHNYLSAQSTDTNLTVGSPADITLDAEPFKKAKRKAIMTRTLLRAVKDKKAERVQPTAADKGQSGVEKDGKLTFKYRDNLEPGVYVAELRFQKEKKDNKDEKDSLPLASFVKVFNVDALREGNLERVSNDHVKASLIDKAEKDMILFEGPAVDTGVIVTKPNDLSESPWFFLAFLVLLVCEQALAVHLSFHVKDDSHGLVPASGRPRQSAAA